jgi:hypothetical protein
MVRSKDKTEGKKPVHQTERHAGGSCDAARATNLSSTADGKTTIDIIIFSANQFRQI